MAGILDFLKAAVVPAAAARAGYNQAQVQNANAQRAADRQSLLDKMKAAMDQSTIAENNARARYYDDGGGGSDDATYVKDSNGNYVALPKKVRGIGGRTGTTSTPTNAGGTSASTAPDIDDNAGGRAGDAEAGAAAAGAAPPKPPTSLGVPTGVTAPTTAPKTPAAARVMRPNVVNPSTGTVEDIYSDGSRKTIRKATPDELAKVNRVPGSGTGTGGTKPMNARSTEAYLQSVADRAIQASGGDVEQAEAAVSNDPDGQKAYANGLATRHFESAKARYDRQRTLDNVRIYQDPRGQAGVTADSIAAVNKGAASSGTKPSVPALTAPTPPSAVKRTTPSGGLIDTMKTAIGTPPPNYQGASLTSGTPGDINLGAGAPAATPPPKVSAARSATGDQATAQAKAAIVIDRIEKSHGAITPEQAMNSKSLNDDVKALVRAHYGLPPK